MDGYLCETATNVVCPPTGGGGGGVQEGGRGVDYLESTLKVSLSLYTVVFRWP